MQEYKANFNSCCIYKFYLITILLLFIMPSCIFAIELQRVKVTAADGAVGNSLYNNNNNDNNDKILNGDKVSDGNILKNYRYSNNINKNNQVLVKTKPIVLSARAARAVKKTIEMDITFIVAGGAIDKSSIAFSEKIPAIIKKEVSRQVANWDVSRGNDFENDPENIIKSNLNTLNNRNSILKYRLHYVIIKK